MRRKSVGNGGSNCILNRVAAWLREMCLDSLQKTQSRIAAQQKRNLRHEGGLLMQYRTPGSCSRGCRCPESSLLIIALAPLLLGGGGAAACTMDWFVINSLLTFEQHNEGGDRSKARHEEIDHSPIGERAGEQKKTGLYAEISTCIYIYIYILRHQSACYGMYMDHKGTPAAFTNRARIH
jgi:hypothetical protein